MAECRRRSVHDKQLGFQESGRYYKERQCEMIVGVNIAKSDIRVRGGIDLVGQEGAIWQSRAGKVIST